MNGYILGNVVRVSTTFALNGTPTDPGTVACVSLDPLGAEITYTYGSSAIVRDTIGVYHLDLTPSHTGLWGYRWVSTGLAAAASEANFYVSSQF